MEIQTRLSKRLDSAGGVEFEILERLVAVRVSFEVSFARGEKGYNRRTANNQFGHAAPSYRGQASEQR
jgi:hypothetical protein